MSESGQSSGWVERFARERDLVYDLRFPDEDSDGDVYFILKVEPQRHDAFKAVLKTPQIIDLSDFGEILYSGWGEPSDDIKDEMRRKYRMYEDD